MTEGHSGSGAATAEEDPVFAEIRAALDSDESALGDVWRRTQQGQTPEEIGKARDTETTTFVWSYLRTAKAILEGDLPKAPTVASGAARGLRRLLKENEFSPDALAVLTERLHGLEDRASDPGARAVEDKRAREASAEAEEHAVPGVYVYALPHYLRHPYDEESGRTLLKVGRADSSVIRRFREQTRTTALPEDPVLLRI